MPGLIVFGALLLRVVHRGDLLPGFDFVGAANGLHTIDTLGARELIRFVVDNQFGPATVWNTYGIPVALLPGFLATLWPSEYWPHVVTAALALLGAGLLAYATDLRREDTWIVPLAWAASPALLSYSVAGFPYLSNTLPFAIALWAVLRRHSWPLILLLLAAAIESAWHVQELGRTVFVVFLAGLFLPGTPRAMRVCWLLAGALQVWLSLRYPSFNTGYHLTMRLPAPGAAPSIMIALGAHFLRAAPDLPFLLLTGLVAIGFTGRARWFWAVCVGSQLTLIFLLPANPGVLHGLSAVWPRRVLLLDFLCVGVVASAFTASDRCRPLLTTLLAAGCLIQLGQTIRWAATPFAVDGFGRTYSLPYTHTPNENGGYLDSKASPFLTDWYRELIAGIGRGRRVLLFYNLSSWDENVTDPAGILDRLYLHLGPREFERHVYVFGEQDLRWSTLPIRPPSDLPSFVQDLKEVDEVDGYWVEHSFDARKDWEAAQRHRDEMQGLFVALSERFEFLWDTPRRQGPHVLLPFHLRERMASP